MKVLAAPRVSLALPVFVRLPAPWMVSLKVRLPVPPRVSGPLTLMLSLTVPPKVRVWPATVGLKRSVPPVSALTVKS